MITTQFLKSKKLLKTHRRNKTAFAIQSNADQSNDLDDIYSNLIVSNLIELEDSIRQSIITTGISFKNFDIAAISAQNNVIDVLAIGSFHLYGSYEDDFIELSSLMNKGKINSIDELWVRRLPTEGLLSIWITHKKYQNGKELVSDDNYYEILLT